MGRKAVVDQRRDGGGGSGSDAGAGAGAEGGDDRSVRRPPVSAERKRQGKKFGSEGGSEVGGEVDETASKYLVVTDEAASEGEDKIRAAVNARYPRRFESSPLHRNGGEYGGTCDTGSVLAWREDSRGGGIAAGDGDGDEDDDEISAITSPGYSGHNSDDDGDHRIRPRPIRMSKTVIEFTPGLERPGWRREMKLQKRQERIHGNGRRGRHRGVEGKEIVAEAGADAIAITNAAYSRQRVEERERDDRYYDNYYDNDGYHGGGSYQDIEDVCNFPSTWSFLGVSSQEEKRCCAQEDREEVWDEHMQAMAEMARLREANDFRYDSKATEARECDGRKNLLGLECGGGGVTIINVGDNDCTHGYEEDGVIWEEELEELEYQTTGGTRRLLVEDSPRPCGMEEIFEDRNFEGDNNVGHCDGEIGWARRPSMLEAIIDGVTRCNRL